MSKCPTTGVPAEFCTCVRCHKSAAAPAEDPPEDLDRDDDLECCHHGLGFDETCEWCDLESREEARAERAETTPQQELPL